MTDADPNHTAEVIRQLETLLRIYDRGIRFGCITADEFDELVELSREIGVTQTIDGPALLGEMIRHMEARMNEPADDEWAHGGQDEWAHGGQDE